MRQHNIEKELDPYERQVLKLFNNRKHLKFGEIIMRLGLSANHGQRILNSLLDKSLVMHSDGSVYMRKE